MVAYDSEFRVDLSKLSDMDLQERRLKFLGGLYAGEKGSRDNTEKQSLIDEIDKEREMRFKRNAESRSNLALLISVVSLFLSLASLYL